MSRNGRSLCEDAFDRVAKEDIQVIVLNMGLPDLDGYGLAKQLRANTRTEYLLLMALTG
ncbi:hypothetical protein [Undibacterium sp. TJN19]|uniref:hypothetical protein n=1 Tax=Undibacterium sp. TJN19 TaxID=3413055 RepID=UPI003BF3FC3E